MDTFILSTYNIAVLFFILKEIAFVLNAFGMFSYIHQFSYLEL